MSLSRPLIAAMAFAVSSLLGCSSNSATPDDGGTDGPLPEGSSDGAPPADAADGSSSTDGPCAFTAALPALTSPDVTLAADGAGTSLYIALNSEIRRYSLASPGSCAGTLDTTFGQAGSLANATPGPSFRIAVDDNGNLFRNVSGSTVAHIGRIWPTPLECTSSDSLFLAVRPDGTAAYAVTGTQNNDTALRVDLTGATCSGVVGAALVATQPNAAGMDPTGKALFAVWRSTDQVAPHPVLVYDPGTDAVLSTIGGKDFFNVNAIHACGQDDCFFDLGHAELSRYTTAGTRTSTVDLTTKLPTGAVMLSGAITNAGTAYIAWTSSSQSTALQISRVAIP